MPSSPSSLLRHRGLQRLLVWGLSLALVAGCAAPPASRPGPAAARTIELAAVVVDEARLMQPGETGLVTVWRDGAALPPRPGLPLQRGDRIDTAERATAVVRWPNGDEVYLRPGSSGRIGSITEWVGTLFAKVRGGFAVETQFVRAGALSTQFLVRTAPGGTTTVTVFDGRVEVGSMRGAWPSVVLPANTTAVAHPRPPQPLPASPQELLATRDWVERVERLVPPAARTADAGGGASQAGKVIAAAAAILALGAIVSNRRDGDRDRGSDAPAGGGTAGTRQTPPPPLAAPQRLRPGSPTEGSPASLYCRDPLALDWDDVAGAHEYGVQLESRAAGSHTAWTPATARTVTASSFTTGAGLSGLFRWRVQARAPGTAGPPSGWLYFSCSTTYLR